MEIFLRNLCPILWIWMANYSNGTPNTHIHNLFIYFIYINRKYFKFFDSIHVITNQKMWMVILFQIFIFPIYQFLFIKQKSFRLLKVPLFHFFFLKKDTINYNIISFKSIGLIHSFLWTLERWNHLNHLYYYYYFSLFSSNLNCPYEEEEKVKVK